MMKILNIVGPVVILAMIVTSVFYAVAEQWDSASYFLIFIVVLVLIEKRTSP